MTKMTDPSRLRNSPPMRVRVVSVFVLLGAVTSIVSVIGLLAPNSLFGAILAAKPEAQEAFTSLGIAAVVGLLVLGAVLTYAAIGLFRGQRGAYVTLLLSVALNALSDLVKLVGDWSLNSAVPVVVAPCVLAYLTTRPFRTWSGLSEARPGANSAPRESADR